MASTSAVDKGVASEPLSFTPLLLKIWSANWGSSTSSPWKPVSEGQILDFLHFAKDHLKRTIHETCNWHVLNSFDTRPWMMEGPQRDVVEVKLLK
jgi:hypothetical protein